MRRHLSTTLIALSLIACADVASDSSTEPTVGDKAKVQSVAAEDAAGEPAAPAASAAAVAELEAAEDRDAPMAAPRAKGARAEGAGAAGRAKKRYGSPSRPGHVDQAAGVRAGEWDDNANYREFMRYLESTSRLPYHRVDLRHRRFIVVRDVNGKSVPGCAVTVSDGRHQTKLVTTASGRALLFPHAEGLSGTQLTASASCGNGSAQSSFSIAADDGMVDLQLSEPRQLAGTRKIDIAFVLDTTGSMGEEIAAVKATINKVASSLSHGNVRVRIGLVEYKDRSDQFLTKVHPMSSNLNGFSRTVSSIRASGGGDRPEDASAGIHAGITRLKWNDDAVSKLVFVIGDAPPHLDYQDGPDYAKDMRVAASRGIKIFTIAASGMDALGQAVWRQLAQYTGGTNMFVLRGGAGPQSTGGGDVKNSCGSTHQNFASGNLDELIVRKVQRELRAIDGDPMRIAGLGQDENAKPCHQRIVLR